MTSNSKFHHVGFVVSAIAESIAGFQQQFGLTWDGRIYHDPIQKVRVTFLTRLELGMALFELVEPADPASPVTRFLAQGGGIHHVCFEVPELAASLTEAKALGGLVLRPPRPAVAFEGRRIAWVLTKHKVLTEFLEAPQ